MLCRELIEKLEELAPRSLACDWDNPGFLAGRGDKKIKKVLVALDATDRVVEQALLEHADLLLTHHPLTLDGVRKIQAETLTGHKIFSLISRDICHYAMHTNYDVVEMGGTAGEMMKLRQPEVLEVTGTDSKTGEPEGIGRVGSLVRPVTVEECAQIVKRIFALDTVKIFGDLDQVIERVAICPGSGKSMIGTAIRKKAQVIITGDIGHHDGIDAVDQGIAVIDAGHYGLEHIFVDHMAQYLRQQFPELEIKKTGSGNPFQVI